jgi:hypothetical protein
VRLRIYTKAGIFTMANASDLDVELVMDKLTSSNETVNLTCAPEGTSRERWHVFRTSDLLYFEVCDE